MSSVIARCSYHLTMDNHDDDETAFAHLTMMMGTGIGELFDAHPGIMEQIATCHLSPLVSSVAGLLTSPEWQASTYRLEVLQHMVIATARGNAQPKQADFKSWLAELGAGHAGLMEDPSEDVFAARVLADGSNFVIFEGLYETSTFHLQRFLDVISDMPGRTPFTGVRRSVLALLRLSDAVARRSEVRPFIAGETMPLAELPIALIRQIPARSRRATFTSNDLAALGVSLNDLAPFIFDSKDAPKLRGERWGHSSLERFPLVYIDQELILALPTAVSPAIRRFLIEFCSSQSSLPTLYAAHANQLSRVFSHTPLLGGKMGPALPYRTYQGLYCADVAMFVDSGRLLHICFIVDDFQGYAEGGMVAPNPDFNRFGETVQESLNRLHEDMSGRDDFSEAISLIVICSWGRPVVIGFGGLDDTRWRIETISAADLETLSWSSSFEPLSLWRLLDSREQLRSMNLNLFNVNGLLNLQGWAESLRGHLIPHARIPEDHDPNSLLQVMIPQNSQLALRKRGAETWNVHYARTWDGRDVRVRRDRGESYFKEDQNRPLYVSMDDFEYHNRAAAVYETEQRGWWAMAMLAQNVNTEMGYDLFQMLTLWLARAAPVLDAALESLPPGPLGWICSFDDEDVSDPAAAIPNKEQAAALLAVRVEGSAIHIHANKGFLLSFRHPTNIGESLLAETLIRGANLVAGRDEFDRVDELMAQIVPDQWARQNHVFTARQFVDFVRSSIGREPVLITDADEAYAKLGLGWRVHDRREGAWIRGVDQCCNYLNRVIDSVWHDIRGRLRAYDREALLLRLFENHEAVALEADRWLRTARSVLSLHRDKAQAEADSATRLAELSASSLATRLLIEIALCECPVSGTKQIGTLDLVRLLANAMQMHILGGWSEAIRFEGKEPELRIAPFGDILSTPDFDDRIAAPYGQALGVKRVRMGARNYETHFAPATFAERTDDAFPSAFLNAWTNTFGFSIDDMRVFLDNIDDEGIRQNNFAFICTKDELAALSGVRTLSPQIVERLLEALTLHPRVSWDSTPPGFAAKDWYPWRFRRRLSLIGRPIVALPGSLTRYLVAPGFTRTSASKLIAYCLNGGYDAKDFPPGPMRSWIGSAENKRGHDFNEHVASTLREHGWQARSDLQLTQILNSKLDKDYGDVDVLAWRDDRILVIECKDLELAMTAGDIARQLHEFRGAEVNGKPDRLKKHMNRFDLLRSRVDDVRRFTKSQAGAGLAMHLVFSDLVPMTFSNIARERGVSITVVDALHAI